MFKAYRYHPQFPTEVSGGVTSLTYSHAIDPSQPLCPIEMVGETCNDAHCNGQHFQTMTIPDNQIIAQLGSLSENDSTNAERREEWSTGLREVIAELRRDSIRDTNIVASRIADFRRKFFNDPTRVLNL
ncbi:hypothetical protein EJ08DRAFT_587413 [Tothia fuscella]|uniref:Putative zinc-finger domain-containing protein n=1 Tax=Tothia fuscella TaxID=1048955 RepID=A0A9P4NSP4_9PEZI|nr:hypothetical protein EJ08DRAFT_587413 [Tothia fuscella]